MGSSESKPKGPTKRHHPGTKDPQEPGKAPPQDNEKPNFNTEYNLPKEIKDKVGQLMHNLNLVTGSLDLIYTKDKEYVFLEINPIGQFGAVSDSANFMLEKKVAELLLHKHG